MKRWLYTTGGVFGVCLLALLVAAIWGAVLPEHHKVERSATYDATPKKIWRVITAHEEAPRWRSTLVDAKRQSSPTGHTVWIQTYDDGDRLVLETTVADPPHRLVRTVRKSDTSFSGEWEFQIETAGGGSKVTLTERGRVANPVVRFVATYMLGYATAVERYLEDLKGGL